MDRDDFAVDLEELFNDIDNAEVVSISFPTFDKSAVFDMRSSESDGPMLRLMPIVSSPRERIRSVRRLRPSFPRPTGLTVIPWHGYVDTLVQNRHLGQARREVLPLGIEPARNNRHLRLRSQRAQAVREVRNDRRHPRRQLPHHLDIPETRAERSFPQALESVTILCRPWRRSAISTGCRPLPNRNPRDLRPSRIRHTGEGRYPAPSTQNPTPLDQRQHRRRVSHVDRVYLVLPKRRGHAGAERCAR